MVEITVGRGSELEGTETDIVERFVIEDHDFIRVFDELMDGEGGVVGFNDGIRDLGGRTDGEGHHDTIRVFFTDLGDEEGTHTGTSTTTEGVGHLETLETVTGFGFLTDDIEDGVNDFRTFSVVTLGPVVTGTSLAEDEVIRAEELTEGTGTDGVHGAWLEVHKDGSGDITATGGFVVVDVDSLELEIRVTVVGSSGVNTVLIGDDVPELGTDLVAALAALNVYDFAHSCE
jgi:hypothetical protein